MKDKTGKELSLNDVIGLNVKGFNFENLGAGFVTIHRSMFDSPLFKKIKYCQGFAFCYILAHAAYENESFYSKNEKVELEPGQIMVGYDKLAKQFNWDSINKVQRFLSKLEKEGTIKRDSNNKGTIITIMNYELYQDAGKAKFIKENLKIGKLTISIDGTLQANAVNKRKTDSKQIVSKRKTDSKQIVTLKPYNHINHLNKEETPEKSGDVPPVVDKTQCDKDKKERSNDIKSIEDVKALDLKEYREMIFYFYNSLPPGCRPKKESYILEWVNTLDKLYRIDKKDKALTERIIKFGRQHNFWSKNFLSIKKLRDNDRNGIKYYERIKQDMVDESNNKKGNWKSSLPKDSPMNTGYISKDAGIMKQLIEQQDKQLKIKE